MNAPAEDPSNSNINTSSGRNSNPVSDTQAAGELLHTLNRTIKTICLYPKQNSQSESAFKKFYTELTAYLQENFRLDIEVHPRELTPAGATPSHPEEAESLLPIKCHESGITALSFTHPFPEESCRALLSLIRASLTSESESADIADALWGNDLEGFHYEVVDDLEIIEYDEEMRGEYFSTSMEGADTSLYREAYGALLADSQGRDSNGEFEIPEQAETALDKLYDDDGRVGADRQDWPTPQQFMARPVQLSDFEFRTAREYARRDESFSASSAMFDLALDLLHEKQELVDFVETLDICLRLHTDLIERGEMLLAAKIVKLIRTAAEKFKETSPVWSRKATETITALSSRERLNRVATALNRLESVTGAEFGEYLHVFDWTAYSGLTDLLGKLEHKNHRLALCAFLAEADDEHIDLLASGIYDKRWYVVRNAVNILLEFNTPRAHKHILKALKHEDIRIRELILSRLEEQSPDFSCKVLEAFICDPDDSIRERAFAMALKQSGAPARELFSRLVEEQMLAKLSPELQQRALNGYAVTGGDEALKSLTAMAKKWSLMESGRRQNRREQFIEAIASCENESARQALKSLSHSWNGNIKKAAKRALKSHTFDTQTAPSDARKSGEHK